MIAYTKRDKEREGCECVCVCGLAERMRTSIVRCRILESFVHIRKGCGGLKTMRQPDLIKIHFLKTVYVLFKFTAIIKGKCQQNNQTSFIKSYLLSFKTQ